MTSGENDLTVIQNTIRYISFSQYTLNLCKCTCLFTYECNLGHIWNTVISLLTTVNSHILSLCALVRERKHTEKVNTFKATSHSSVAALGELHKPTLSTLKMLTLVLKLHKKMYLKIHSSFSRHQSQISVSVLKAQLTTQEV